MHDAIVHNAMSLGLTGLSKGLSPSADYGNSGVVGGDVAMRRAEPIG